MVAIQAAGARRLLPRTFFDSRAILSLNIGTSCRKQCRRIEQWPATLFQLETGPVPDATPDVLDGGLEERPQKRIASAGCRRLAGRCTEHLLTDLWAARPGVLCRGVHRSCSFHWTDHWRTDHWTER